MDIFIILLFIVILIGIKVPAHGNKDYITKNQTDSIKGIFAIIILFSHMRQYYVSPIDKFGTIYLTLLNFLGQLMVVMFFLYSGYGVMESLKRDARKYIQTFFTRRFFKVWLMFAIAVFLFAILNQVLGHDYTSTDYLFCWVGWTSIGNSNWFVFDILLLYLLTYFIFLIIVKCNKNLVNGVNATFILTLGLLIFLVKLGKESYWYDTILAYPLGMYFSLYRSQLEKRTRGYRWFLWLSILIVLFVICRFGYTHHFFTFSPKLNLLVLAITSSIFALILVMLTMKVRIDNRILRWLGVNAFAIYILQRLAMIGATHFHFNENSVVFACIVIPTTLLITVIFSAVTGKINKFLLKY